MSMDRISNTVRDGWEHTTCPLCGEDRPRVLLRAPDRLYGFPGEFVWVRCDGCRHVYLDPRPTPQTIAQFYPEDYGPHRGADQEAKVDSSASSAAVSGESSGGPSGTSSSAQPWYLSRLTRGVPGLRRFYYWLRETCATVVPDPVGESAEALELGCGDGRFLVQLRDRGWGAVGIEPAASAAARARQRGFHVHTGVLGSQQFSKDSFDAVFAWMVLEHLHDPRAVVDQIHRILRSGGYFALSVPNFGCWEPKVFRSFWYAIEPTHLQQFTPRTLRGLLLDSGFSIERWIHQRNVFNLVGSCGLLARRTLPRSRLGDRLIRFTDHPSMWGQLALAPLAKLLAWVHQGGRLTVVCRVHK
jgi:SAM-dependent methyltransferase